MLTLRRFKRTAAKLINRYYRYTTLHTEKIFSFYFVQYSPYEEIFQNRSYRSQYLLRRVTPNLYCTMEPLFSGSGADEVTNFGFNILVHKVVVTLDRYEPKLNSPDNLCCSFAILNSIQIHSADFVSEMKHAERKNP
jgi:hypothetical protein